MRERKLFEILLEISDTGECLLSDEEIVSLTSHRDDLIRMEACYALSAYPEDLARDCYLRLLVDKEPLVRVAAAESLDFYEGDEDVCKALLSAYQNDRNTLTRAYAGYSLLSVARSKHDVVSLVEASLPKEHYVFVRLQCYYGLYRFCGKDVLREILACFGATKHLTRVATAKVLREMLDDGLIPGTDYPMISAQVRKLLDTECLPDLKEALAEVLKRVSKKKRA